jgi:hypothetical protein
MKTLLAILLSFIVTEAPVLAIHGGYTLGGVGNTAGTYAGVFVPTSDVITTGTSSGILSSSSGSNNLGLFTLNIPTTGVGTGNVLLFSSGRTFTGTIDAIPDPANANGIRGLITATFNFTFNVVTTSVSNGTVVQTVSPVNVTATALGAFTATTVTTSATTQSPTGVLLSGATTLQIDQGAVSDDGSPVITETAAFDIEGYQQSSSSTTGAETF